MLENLSTIDSFIGNLEEHLVSIGRDRDYLIQVTGVSSELVASMFDDRKWPTLGEAIQIADGLGVSVNYLVYGHDISLSISVEQNRLMELVEPYPEELRKQAREALEIWIMSRQAGW
jgi:hypothetical protein